MISKSKSLITLTDPHSVVSECYKAFRTNLSCLDLDQSSQAILFTSCHMREGKTTSLVNTAISFAQIKRRVLVIDCDLRKGRINEVFKLPQAPGLLHALQDPQNLLNYIHKIDVIPHLHILTSGAFPSTPSELLASQTMRQLIQEAKLHFDLVLVDAPPVLSITDASIVARYVDGVVMIVAANETKRDDFKRAKKKLEQVKANILGVLMTKTDAGDKKHYEYYLK